MSRNETNATTATPTTPTTPTTPPTPGLPNVPLATKLCHIVKRPDFEGYGFNLHSEKVKPGQYIGKVDANSPAEAAGLKEGDRIIEVNGVAIGNETHKQAVQRIKAIACEVRLLLIDVDGKGGKVPQSKAQSAANHANVNAAANGSGVGGDRNSGSGNGNDIASRNGSDSFASNNGNGNAYHGTVQEMPGASANISSISMKSTKRISNGSQQSYQNQMSDGSSSGTDVTDKALPAITNVSNGSGNGHAALMTAITPPPPSATVAKAGQTQMATTGPMMTTTTTTSMSTPTSTPNGNKAGSLQLPMTAAEMRAKLMSKKKYDPKNESVDLKKKFEIIQKL